jgi:hypothetical protein
MNEKFKKLVKPEEKKKKAITTAFSFTYGIK